MVVHFYIFGKASFKQFPFLHFQNGTYCYLAALCHYKAGEYQEAINLLEAPRWPIHSNIINKNAGGSLITDQPILGGLSNEAPHKPIPLLDDVIAIECSRQLLRAMIYEAADNPTLAGECYKAALMADPYCYDALKALTSHCMLTVQEERELVDSLPLDVHCETKHQAEFVRVCYETKLNKCSVTCSSDIPKCAEDQQTPVLLKSTRQKTDLENLPDSLNLLSSNLDVLSARAESLYYKCKFAESYYLTKTVLDQDPFHSECLPVHIACLIELHQPNALFLLAHKLIDLYPETALAWFAVGCYYYLIGKNEQARRYLSKSTTIDKSYGPAWIAFAHSFAAENEHDQASAAYFKAARLMKGCHLPLLYIGMEYSSGNNPKFAENFFKKASEMAPNDPFVLHEIGVVSFNGQE